MLRRTTPRGLLAPLAVTATAVLVLASCSGSDDDGGSEAGADKPTPAEVLATAKTTLDDTSGVELTLATDDLPSGVTGIKAAKGTATHAPAFDGSLTVVLAGQSFEVPVIAVGGTVYAQIPLTPGWSDIDPGDYGAPDPAELLDPDTGFSALLPATTGVKAGDSVRGGADNSEILTEYTGTVPDTAVKNVIPTAQGDFDATYEITDDGELRSVELTGAFYGSDEKSLTYTIGFDDYGTTKDIKAP